MKITKRWLFISGVLMGVLTTKWWRRRITSPSRYMICVPHPYRSKNTKGFRLSSRKVWKLSSTSLLILPSSKYREYRQYYKSHHPSHGSITQRLTERLFSSLVDDKPDNLWWPKRNQLILLFHKRHANGTAQGSGWWRAEWLNVYRPSQNHWDN